MPYLSTSQEYLEQSALLLQAYPDTTRITTKYSYPSSKKSTTAPSSQPTTTKSKPSTTETPTTSAQTQSQSQSQTQSQTPTPATLTLKTFHPTSGICLKYRTNKAAEVGRLIVGLGKLASGAPVVETTAAAGTAGDTEMVDAPTPAAPASAPGPGAGAGGKGPSGGGGKSKKKGKGKK
ncbi:hypothetical protein GX50_00144 [[Emmonsia] crescens]|uniref:SRP9 domain-containing protein n=1 Tax=[Emmonsia] crescens TaxID=73230 RepID=A0A2B7ZUE0_9EURO|nr:hypothetical protein GX50_00144 [Emmonsia crescens]